ncbi:MAG: outer-membrane lipoprotein carrier protein LolA [Thiolinea sp.]
MQSGFIQEVFDDKGQLKQKSRGVVFLQRPGRFRWQYAERTSM